MARRLETIQNDHKRSHKIAAIKAELQPAKASNIILEELTEKEIEQIATIRTRFPPRKNNGQACNNGQSCNSSASNPNNICRYCNKKGHLQKECSLATEGPRAAAKQLHQQH
jgi:hypothetical protein